MFWVWMSLAVVGGLVILGVLSAPGLLRAARRRELGQAVQLFRRQREMLEAKFVELAAGQGKPRGLIWKQVDWRPGVSFGRDLHSGLLTAFASIKISFEAVPGGDMEEVAAVSAIRDAVAVFHYRRGRWGTGGKALFNMSSTDALARLRDQFEPAGAVES
jgi:hypothetical protein